MLQLRYHPCLVTESLLAQPGADLRREVLEDDLAAEVRIGSEEDPRHPAAAELANDGVLLTERAVGHKGEDRPEGDRPLRG